MQNRLKLAIGEDLYQSLQEMAEKKGISVEELTRQIVLEAVELEEDKRRRDNLKPVSDS